MVIQGLGRTLFGALEALRLRRPAARKARLYCVGAPRTGTHTIAAIFDRSIRSAHEPGLREVARHVLAHHHGAVSFDDLRRFVRRRDARLRLDVDSSHANAFLIEALLAEFDDARFLLTIRDCYSWLDSATNHTFRSGRGSRGDRAYLEFWFGPGQTEHSPHDALLRQRGLPGIDCFLRAWNRHNRVVLDSVPAEHLLVVRTDAIAARLPAIATFAGIAPDRLVGTVGRHGRARVRHGLLRGIDEVWLTERVALHCGELMQRFFPEFDSPRAAAALRPER